MKGESDQAVFRSVAYVTREGNATVLDGEHWRVAGATDFDDDGYLDVFCQNVSTGELKILILGSRNPSGVPVIRGLPLGSAGLDWQLKAIGDYAGDRRDDAIFQRTSDGQLSLWVRQGDTFAATEISDPPPPVWEASGPR
jgi:hypothetical protein